MSPSPMREEYHRETTVWTASVIAITATTRESRMTTEESFGITPSSTRLLSRAAP